MTYKNLRELILSIENSDQNTINNNIVCHTFELSPQTNLIVDLSGWIGTLIVRAILFELSVNEHHIFQWRPENKFIQYLILSYYSPGCLPKTYSLTDLLSKKEWVTNFRELIKSGYFIKATLGFGSGRKQNFDHTSEFEQILLNYKTKHSFQNEKWIVQKRLDINKEFRIHTFGKDVLYGLTLKISGSIGLTDFDLPQEFVKSILERLPSSFIEGTLIGWDIGLTKKGKFYVIEANFTGFHPEFSAGFQTTGYVEDPPSGTIVCAWLHAYFKNKFKVSIASFDDILQEKFPYIEEFSYYISILKNEHVDALIKGKGRVRAIYVFLDEHTDYNIIKLITFMVIGNFAESYYIITNQELQEDAKRIFFGENFTHVSEHSFFTKNEYKKLELLDNESRRELRINHAIKLSGGMPHLVI